MRGKRNHVVGRMILVLLGAVALPVLAEVCLRWAGYGYPTPFLLPYVIEGRPVLVDNQFFGYRFFPEKATRTAQPLVLEPGRGTNTYRVVVLGESAAMGDPLPDFGLARVLEVVLADQLPGRRVEVVNAAMTAINSHVVREIARELPALRPDAVVIYLGNNEVIGPYGPGAVRQPLARSLAYIRASVLLSRTCLGQLLAQGRRRVGRSAEPEGWGGMPMFLDHELTRDDVRLDAVYRNYAANLEAVIGCARDAGAKVVLSTVAVSRRACPPFGSRHGRVLAPTEARAWDAEFSEGRRLEAAHDPAAAAQAYARTAAIDDTYAELHYRLARCLEQAGRTREAEAHYEEARDLDTLRFRADARLNAIARARGQQADVTLVDADDLLRGADEADVFVDHVHFSFRGNVMLAGLLAHGLLGPSAQPRVLSDTERRCAAALAYTAWDEWEMVRTVRERMEHPPFSTQRESAARLADLRARAATIEVRARTVDLSDLRGAYESALAGRPKDVALHARFGEHLLDAGALEDAAREMATAEAEAPHRFDLRGNLAHVLALLGRPDEALRVLRGSDRIYGHFLVHVCTRISDALLATGAYAEALPFLAEVVRRQPGDPVQLLRLAEAEQRAGRLADAAGHLERLLRDHPNDARARSVLGLVEVELGQRAAGLDHLQKAAASQPNEATLQYNLGVGLLRSGDSAGAEAAFRRSLELDASDAEANLQLGQLLGARGDWPAALEFLKRAEEARPDLAPAQHQIATAFRAMARYPEAVAKFDRLIAVDTNNVRAINDLAWLLATCPDAGVRNGTRALALAKQAEVLTGGHDARAQEALAASYAEMGDFTSAVAIQGRALAAARGPLTNCLHQRLALYEIGQPFRGGAASPCP